jgi:predicted phosphate transport protein (TIGR00153 family)
MGWRLIPKEEKFYSMFQAQADHLVKASKEFLRILENFNEKTLDEHASTMRAIEHEGDILCHDIIRKLNQTFVTPFDREDILDLTSRMDDILDLIEGTIGRMKIFKIKQSTPEQIKLAKILVQACEEIARAMEKIEDLHRLPDHCIEINRLENEADTVTQQILGVLFENRTDPIEIIKWKEIYEIMELATDKCEDVANTLEGIMLKNA